MEERSKPTPKRKRQAEEELSALRTENAALRQSKEIADRDRADLFEQLQKAERRAKGKEQAFGMVSDMLAAYPDEFDALLNKSRAKKAVPYYKGNSRATTAAESNKGTKNLTAAQVSRQENMRTGIERAAAAEI